MSKAKTKIVNSKAEAKGIDFRQFVLAAYCAHGDPIGRTWNAVLNCNGPDSIRLSPLERVLGLLKEWVLSDAYVEPEQYDDIVWALRHCRIADEPTGLDTVDRELIAELMEEWDHALELMAPESWNARQGTLVSKMATQTRNA